MKTQKVISIDKNEMRPCSNKSQKQTTRYTPRLQLGENTRKKAKQLEQKVHRPTKQRQKIQEPIPSYLPKKRENPVNIEKEPNTISKTLLLNNPRLIALRESLFENNNISDYDEQTLNKLMEHLREYSAYCALQRKYDDAELANKLYERIRDEVQVNNVNANNGKNEVDDDIPYHELKKIKAQQFQEELDDYDRITIQKREELESRLSVELDDFEENWKENMPRKYRKPSAKLIELFEIERKFGLTGQFNEAKKIKAEADRLQAIEMNQAQKRLVQDYTIAKKKFDHQQYKERQLFEETREHWRSIIEAKHKVEMEAIENRKTVLEVKQSETKCIKESSIDPPKIDIFNNGGAAFYRRENIAPKDILLPPLIAPNDERIKELQMKEIEQQKNKNQQFKAYKKQKEMEDDLSRYSDPSERQTPSNSARSDLLPVPKLNIHKDKSKKVKKVVPPSARSGNSSHRSGRCDEIPQLDVRFDVDQVRNILKDQIHFGLSSTENETKVKSPRNNENENMNINENMNRNENGSAGTSAPPEKVKSITFRLTETDNVKTEIQL